MPPVNKMRTYRPSTTINNSVDAVNTLFARNMTKRLIDKKKRNKIVIKQLPARAETLLADESLHVSTEDTFDKLRLGVTSNRVKKKKSVSFKLYKFSNYEQSNNQTDSGSINNSELSVNKSNSIKNNSNFSPPMTRNRMNKSTSIQNSNKSDSLLHRFEEPTVSKLESLEIEGESKKPHQSLSYFKNPQSIPDINKTETSYNNVFSNSFRDKPTIHCSTPLIPAAKKMATTSFPVRDMTSLFKQSFAEIKNWGSKFPVENKNRENTSQNNKSVSDYSEKSPEFINLRKRKVMKYSNTDSETEVSRMRRLTVSLEEFNSFVSSANNICIENVSQPSHKTYNLKEFENFIDSNYGHSIHDKSVPFSFVTNRGRKHRFTNSSICLGKTSGIKKRRYNSLDSLLLDDSQKHATESSQVNHTSLENLSTSHIDALKLKTQLIVQIERLPIDEQRLNSPAMSQNSQVSNFHSSLDSSCMKSKVVEPTNKKTLFVRLEKNFEDFYIKNYTSSFEGEISYNSLPSQNEINSLSSGVVTSRTFESLNSSENSSSVHNNIKNTLFVNITNKKIADYSSSNQESLEEIARDNISDLKLDNCNEHSFEDEISYSCQSLVPQDDIMNLVINVTDKNVEELHSPYTSHKTHVKDDLVVNINDSKLNNTYVSNISESSYVDDKISIHYHSLESEDAVMYSITRKQPCTISEYKNNKEDHSLGVSNIPNKQNSVNSPDMFANSTNVLILSHTPTILETEPEKLSAIKSKSINENKNTDPILENNSEETGKGKKSINIANILPEKTNDSSPLGNIPDVIESSIIDLTESDDECRGFKVPKLKKTNMLKPGKLWRRSFLNIRKSNLFNQLIHEENKASSRKVLDTCEFSKHVARKSQLLRRSSIRFVPIVPLNVPKTENKTTLLEEFAKRNSGYVPHQIQQEILENSFKNLSLSLEEKNTNLEDPLPVTAKEVVFRKCGQVEPLTFQKCYPESVLQHCHKVGEGVYGEVFLFKNPGGGTSVIKIIPIEGDQIVNGERQKKFDEILSEVVIATELSNLRHKVDNSTAAFNEVQQIRCVQGSYPKRLLDLWDLYDETQKSENDCPEMFDEDQLYMVLQLSHGGKDLESYLFNNAMQAYAMFEQIAFALAVAENQLNFEHRDLHWGNILLLTVEKNKVLNYILNGKSYDIPTRGVEASIIDFTLSRIEHEGVILYNDLSMDDELFTGLGDYQFEVYRSMQEKNGNNWQCYEPFTNVLWLHYVLEKAISALRYKNTQSKIHKEYTAKLKLISNEILKYKSATDFVLNYLV